MKDFLSKKHYKYINEKQILSLLLATPLYRILPKHKHTYTHTFAKKIQYFFYNFSEIPASYK